MLGHSAFSETPISALPEAAAAPATVYPVPFLGLSLALLDAPRPRFDDDLMGIGFSRGPRIFLREYTAQGAGLHRVADDNLSRYELFHTEDTVEPADPDIDAVALATFSGLPYETAALTYPAIHKFVLCRRNRYGLLSRNRTAWRVELDATGAVVVVKPSAPLEYTIEAAAAGAFKVTARYEYLPDGAYAANQWLIYLRTNGTNPDPSVDTPTVVSLVKVGGSAYLEYTTAGFAHGTTGKAIVRTRRTGSPNADSQNLTVVTATASTAGPAAPSGGVFFGGVAEQKQ